MKARNICQISLVVAAFALLGLVTSQLAVAQTPAYTITDLGTLGGTHSTALSINTSGQVTGYSETADRKFHAFLYIGGTMIDLGTLGGANSYAHRISDSGIVVGRAQNATGLSRPFSTIIGSPVFDLSSLDARLRGPFSAAVGVNSAGQVVGHFRTAGGHGASQNRAFLYTSSITDPGWFWLGVKRSQCDQ